MSASDGDAVRATAEEIWTQVLGVPDAPSGATFFELGGQSISAVLIVSRLQEELSVSMEVGDLFDDPDRDSFVREVVTRAGVVARVAR